MVAVESRCPTRFCTIAGALALGFGLAVPTAHAQQIEPEADKILHSMADYVAGLKAFTVNYDAESEVVDTDGQKLQYNALGIGRARTPRQAACLPQRSLRRRRADVRRQDDLDLRQEGQCLRAARKPRPDHRRRGRRGAGGDRLRRRRSRPLCRGSLRRAHRGRHEGRLRGLRPVGGVECDHLAFRNPRVDWQIWVQKGEQPLPLKYVITTKWVTGAPQYSLRLSDWNVAPQIDPAQFTFTAPEGARKLEEISADEIGELSAEGVQ